MDLIRGDWNLHGYGAFTVAFDLLDPIVLDLIVFSLIVMFDVRSECALF